MFRMTKLEQLLGGYLNPECDSQSALITLLLAIEELPDPFADATVEYAQEVVQIWKPPHLKGIDW